MPAKNRLKEYIADGYYHLYNRGVDKRIIFDDQQDYAVFLSYLKTYLLPKNEKELREKLDDPNIDYKTRDDILKLLRLNNFNETLDLMAYCLMPNHFHFLVHQTPAETIDRFMNSLCTRYSMYFNKRNKRVGPLFQGVYKAVVVETEEQLLHLSRYIHAQALGSQGQALQIEQPSSYLNYLRQISQEWVKPDQILSFFKTAQKRGYRDFSSYQSFVEEYKGEGLEIIHKLTLEQRV
jgi:putative transposase